jgi:predicted dinucleotide-binding enzyme
VFADLVPGARVVKAFNHLRAEVLASDPGLDGGRRVLFYSGDDTAAKGEIAALIERLGFSGIDLGPLEALSEPRSGPCRECRGQARGSCAQARNGNEIYKMTYKMVTDVL